MDQQEIIEQYLEGWRIGNGVMSLQVTANEFTYDDPNTGIISRSKFLPFFNGFKQSVSEITGKVSINPFLNYTDTVFDRKELVWIVWCWWCAGETNFQGSAIIKVSKIGVLSEKIAYYSKLPKQ